MPLKAGFELHTRSALAVQTFEAYVPDEHASTAHVVHVLDPVLAWNWPEAQSLQAIAPTVLVNEPAAHATQCAVDDWSTAPLPYWPIAHDVHSELVEDVVSLNVPCVHE
jgi:hypothetical protein